jgi:hypothetical protein
MMGIGRSDADKAVVALDSYLVHLEEQGIDPVRYSGSVISSSAT